MRHKLLVLRVKNFYNRCTFTEVIAKLKLGYRFFWTTRYTHRAQSTKV